jgi:hypothetical protein
MTERRDDGANGGAADLLYVGKAARRRQPRSGGARPEEAAHRNRDYTKKCAFFDKLKSLVTKSHEPTPVRP